MKRLMVAALSLLLALSVSAQQTKKTDHKPATKKAAAGSNAAIDAVRKAWEDAYNAKQTDKLADLYTDDAVMANNGGVFKGKDQIKADLQKGIDQGNAVHSITPTRTEISGNLAYDEGTFQQKMGDKEVSGDYLVVLKKVGGQWKVAAHNSVVPQAPPQ